MRWLLSGWLLCACATPTVKLPVVSDKCKTANDSCVSRCFGEPGLLKAQPDVACELRDAHAMPARRCNENTQPVDTLALASCSSACEERAKLCE